MNRYFSAVWRAKWLIIAATVFVAGATWFYARRQPSVYTASGLLQIGRVWKDQLEDPYLVAETINSPGFAHDLAPSVGLKQGQVKRSIRATAVTAGPARSSYPILVQVTATTVSPDESAKLAQAVANEIIKRHDALFDRALSPHLTYQRIVESMLANAGFPPESTLAASPNRTSSTAGRQAGDEVIKWERELQDVKTANTAPTYTERSHLLDTIVATGSVAPDVLRPTITAASVALLVAIVFALLLQSLSASPRDAALADAHTGVRQGEVRS